jgi:hypothetical protein
MTQGSSNGFNVTRGGISSPINKNSVSSGSFMSLRKSSLGSNAGTTGFCSGKTHERLIP